jgi:hypothetical protein
VSTRSRCFSPASIFALGSAFSTLPIYLHHNRTMRADGIWIIDGDAQTKNALHRSIFQAAGTNAVES